jgi:transposase
MLIERIAPVAQTEFAPVFVAWELSRSKWLVGVGAPRKWTVRRHQVEGGDLYGLLELLGRIGAEEEKRGGLPVKVHVCFEAGRDGHWLYRALKLAGYEAYEIEPASVAVDRRARRAKSDGVDVDKLVRTLARFVRGELDACRIVAVPSEAEEDAKRPHRESERLVKEQTSHRNRVKALLFAQGVRDFDPMAPDGLERLAALPIMPKLKAELIREGRRLAGIIADIAAIEAEMKAAIVPPKKAKPASAACGRVLPRPRPPSSTGSRASASLSARRSRARSLPGRFRTGAASGNISAWRRLPSKAATWRATRGSPRPATNGRARR